MPQQGRTCLPKLKHTFLISILKHIVFFYVTTKDVATFGPALSDPPVKMCKRKGTFRPHQRRLHIYKMCVLLLDVICYLYYKMVCFSNTARKCSCRLNVLTVQNCKFQHQENVRQLSEMSPPNYLQQFLKKRNKTYQFSVKTS